MKKDTMQKLNNKEKAIFMLGAFFGAEELINGLKGIDSWDAANSYDEYIKYNIVKKLIKKLI